MEPNNQTKKFLVMPIAGFARAGKDTLANAIFDEIGDRIPEFDCVVLKFADALKQSLQKALSSAGVDIDVFTEDPAEKEKLRPLLVAYGEYCRSKNPNVWVDKVIEGICEYVDDITETDAVGSVIIIPDMRYANEHDNLGRLCKARGWVFAPTHINRIEGPGAANPQELASVNELIRIMGPDAEFLCFNDGDTAAIASYAAQFVGQFRTRFKK